MDRSSSSSPGSPAAHRGAQVGGAVSAALPSPRRSSAANSPCTRRVGERRAPAAPPAPSAAGADGVERTPAPGSSGHVAGGQRHRPPLAQHHVVAEAHQLVAVRARAWARCATSIPGSAGGGAWKSAGSSTSSLLAARRCDPRLPAPRAAMASGAWCSSIEAWKRVKQRQAAHVADEERAARGQRRERRSQHPHADSPRSGKYWTTELMTMASNEPGVDARQARRRAPAPGPPGATAARSQLGPDVAPARPARSRRRCSARSRGAEAEQEQARAAADLQHAPWAPRRPDALGRVAPPTRASRLGGDRLRRCSCCSSRRC